MAHQETAGDLELETEHEHEEHDESMLRWALAPLVTLGVVVFLFLSLWSMLALIPLLIVAVPAAYLYFRSKRELDEVEEVEHEAALERPAPAVPTQEAGDSRHAA
jgi:hypothetical protein